MGRFSRGQRGYPNVGAETQNSAKGLSVFEKYLTLWVVLCIGAGIVLGKFAPGFAKALDGMAMRVGEGPRHV